jgi:hypothetical protein
MALNHPHMPLGEETFVKKLIFKIVAYLLQGDDGGERHELAALYLMHRGSLTVDSTAFKVASAQNFSRSKLAVGNVTHGIGSVCDAAFFQANWQFLSPLDSDAKLFNGANEIDALAQADGDAGPLAFIEAKSGGAGSSGSQTSSYMEASVALAKEKQKDVWFVHYHDTATETEPAYQWNCFETIAHSLASQVPEATKPRLAAMRKAGVMDTKGDAAAKIKALIGFYSTHNPAPPGKMGLSGDTVFKQVTAMNTIMKDWFGVQVHSAGYSRKIDRNMVIGWLTKLLPEAGDQYYDTGVVTSGAVSTPEQFWMKIYRTAT